MKKPAAKTKNHKKPNSSKKKGVTMNDEIREGILRKSIDSDRYIPIIGSAEREEELRIGLAPIKSMRENKDASGVEKSICRKG
jgi:hypothetical protein